MKIKAILFDMIGTTVLEKNSNSIRDSFRSAFREHGVTADDEVIGANRGKDKMVMINIILQKGNYPSHLAPRIFESFKENLNKCLGNFEPAEHVDEVFRTLIKMGIQTGLGTGLPQDPFEKLLDHLGWVKTNFHYIGISSVLGKARPDPAMIIDMMRVLDIQDKSAVIKVGDTVADIEEGKNAGVKTIAVLSGTQPKDKLVAVSPDFVINKISDIIEILKSLK